MKEKSKSGFDFQKFESEAIEQLRSEATKINSVIYGGEKPLHTIPA